jgi:hypothetical protein
MRRCKFSKGRGKRQPQSFTLDGKGSAKDYIFSFLNSPSGIERTTAIITRQNQGT